MLIKKAQHSNVNPITIRCHSHTVICFYNYLHAFEVHRITGDTGKTGTYNCNLHWEYGTIVRNVLAIQ